MWRLGSRFQSVRAHERALAALRDISERAPFVSEPARGDAETSRAIQVLDDRTSAAPDRRAAAALAAMSNRRQNAAKHDRPTIASIPTVGWRPASPPEPAATTEPRG
jgi:hypothetical protein